MREAARRLQAMHVVLSRNRRSANEPDHAFQTREFSSPNTAAQRKEKIPTWNRFPIGPRELALSRKNQLADRELLSHSDADAPTRFDLDLDFGDGRV